MSIENPTNVSTSQPFQTPPDNYLVWAILSTVLCCLPFGIVSIIYATQVNSKFTICDFDGANQASANAKKWAIIAAVVGGIFIVVYFLFFFVFGGMAMLGKASQHY